LKLFDVVGAIVVLTWVGLASLYVYNVEGSKSGPAQGLAGEFVMHEGETWLLLRRDKQDKEVGFVHQTRTSIEDGWLLEYDMLMTIELLGTERSIETRVKSRLDGDGYLEGFSADVNASGRSFRAKGEVEDKTIHISLNLGGEPRQQSIELEDKPRLSSSALNQLLASGELEAGEEFSERFFDPTTMQMTEMVMVYKGKKVIDVYDEEVPGHHVVQKVAGSELDVYVDDEGGILIQEFPLRMIGARVPPSFGRTRASVIRQRFKEQKKRQEASGGADEGFEFNLGTAMELLSGQKPDKGEAERGEAERGEADKGEADKGEADDEGPTLEDPAIEDPTTTPQ
jgi:hypothetical protein